VRSNGRPSSQAAVAATVGPSPSLPVPAVVGRIEAMHRDAWAAICGTRRMQSS
jgi:hypothetical protein